MTSTGISDYDIKLLMRNLYDLNNLSKKFLQDLKSKNQVVCDSINDCKTCVYTLKSQKNYAIPSDNKQ